MFAALILSLPTRDATLRMRVWRALKDAGCGVLRDGVYVLPVRAPARQVLTQMQSAIRAAGGFAMTVELRPVAAADRTEVRKLFDRSADYGALVAQMDAAHPGSERTLQRLRRSLAHLMQIDFFPGPARRQAEAAMARLARQRAGGEPRAARKRLRTLPASRYQKRTWATRKDPWIDRLASAWLIKRFIDREARFAWIERPRDRPKGTVGFDFDGAEFTHVGERVTFEVLLASFGLEDDPALVRIGKAVHYLDAGGIPVADAAGLETALRGSKEKTRGDDARLAAAMRVFDLFYSAYATTSVTEPSAASVPRAPWPRPRPATAGA
jgi:hypothetical protein